MVAFGGAKTRKRRVKPGRLRKVARGEGGLRGGAGGLRMARVGLRLEWGGLYAAARVGLRLAVWAWIVPGSMDRDCVWRAGNILFALSLLGIFLRVD